METEKSTEYMVLARRCRPQSFEEVVGQEHVITTLKNAISLNRIAHAYLFTGSRGVGKTSIARIFAKALNCKEGPTVTPCGKCISCVEITQGNSMDVIEIDGASNRKIDQIRNLREEVKFSPVSSKFKVYIIDEVHMLTQEAFNALLKTLEEPPPYVKFFFATTEPHKIPITILSRCQRFDLKFIEIENIVERLKKIGDEEKLEIEDKALFLIAKMAAGSMRDAESVFDKVIAFCDKKVTNEDILSILGLVDKEVYFDLTQTIVEQDINLGLKIVNDIVNNNSNLGQFLGGFLEHVRDLLMAVILGEEASAVIKLPEESIQKILEQSKHFSEDQLIYIMETISQIKQEVKYAISSTVALEVGIIKIIKSNDIVSLKDIISKIEKFEKFLGGSDAKVAVSVDSGLDQRMPKVKKVSQKVEPSVPEALEVPVKSVGLDFSEIKSAWKGFLKQMKAESPLINSFLSEARLMELKDNVLSLELNEDLKFLISEDKKKVLGEKARQFINQDLKISLQFTNEGQEERKKKLTEGNNLLDDPLIKQTLKIFDKGQILDVKRRKS